MPQPSVNTQEFARLVQVVETLRGPNGCPWDKEQTHQTLTQYAIEEAHELAEAIDSHQRDHIIEELGDLLLQVVLHSEIARQSGEFTLKDVLSRLTEKMIRRHPHVFSDVQVANSKEVLKNWAHIKDQEKGPAQTSDPFSNIPRNLPALIRAQKIGSKSVRYNFDWSSPEEVLLKVDEELAELKEAISNSDPEGQRLELGDLLFSVVQLARHLGFDAEQSLRLTNKKFEVRFLKMRQLVEQDHKDFMSLSTKELESYWKKAKKELRT